MAETGIIPNIDRFGILISSCTGYGTRYNPSNNKIKLPALETVRTKANQSVLDITAQSVPRDTVINSRFLLFQELPLYVTRIISALIASENVEKVTIADAMVWVRKIRGERKSKKILNPSPTDPKQISASQHSYANQVEFFDQLITFVIYQAVYQPNETDLLEPALRDFETQLRQANKDCVDVNTPYLNALYARDVILYAPVTGLVDLALATKKYVKSVKAISPDEYAQIASLKFTRPRKKK
jgi:hypothetical protein